MRILITNDDGINAPGLATLHEIAVQIAGDAGEVWTVAPAFEQSGVGHCISYARPFMVSQFGTRRFAVEGSPADCVLAAIYDVMPDRPDLVLSGVNRGNNAGENTLYSGTIGAAIEAALQGLPAIALSQFYGPGNVGLEDQFEAAATHGARCIRTLLDKGIWGGDTYQVFYNVNFPPCAASEVKGTAITAQGMRSGATFSVVGDVAPNSRRYLYVQGARQDRPTAPGTDVAANLDNMISVTPMRADLTDHDAVEALRDAFQ